MNHSDLFFEQSEIEFEIRITFDKIRIRNQTNECKRIMFYINCSILQNCRKIFTSRSFSCFFSSDYFQFKWKKRISSSSRSISSRIQIFHSTHVSTFFRIQTFHSTHVSTFTQIFFERHLQSSSYTRRERQRVVNSMSEYSNTKKKITIYVTISRNQTKFVQRLSWVKKSLCFLCTCRLIWSDWYDRKCE